MKSNNQGWRYVWYASGALVFVMSMARIFVIRLKETPKFLIGEGKDAEAVDVLQHIASKYNRPCSLTLEQLTRCGTLTTRSTQGKSKWSPGAIGVHLAGLYATRRIGISTTLIWLSWTLIGLAYPLYNVFLPAYLQSRGAAFGQPSAYTTWRNYTLVNFSGIWGPVLAGLMCHTRLGRKYTMVIGALVTMAFFFAYTQVRTATQNVVFTCVINFCLNVYYGTLYAYTPEVLPSAHRGTGNGIAIGWNRVMGILSAVIATVADVSLVIAVLRGRKRLTRRRLRRRCRYTSARRCIFSWRVLRRSSLLSRMVSGVHRTRYALAGVRLRGLRYGLVRGEKILRLLRRVTTRDFSRG
jgi:hypothetical protein